MGGRGGYHICSLFCSVFVLLLFYCVCLVVPFLLSFSLVPLFCKTISKVRLLPLFIIVPCFNAGNFFGAKAPLNDTGKD